MARFRATLTPAIMRSLFTETEYIKIFCLLVQEKYHKRKSSRGRNTVLCFPPNAFKMHPTKPLFAKVVMGLLTSILTSASVLGNGFIIAIIARFKSLRTVPNIFISNLALVDLLNSAINLPITFMSSVLEHNKLRGRAMAIAVAFSLRLFVLLNLASMLATMADMYLAICLGLRYFVWKTKQKVLIGVCLIWIISIMMVTFLSAPLLDIDLGDAHIRFYRSEIFKEEKYFIAGFMAFFIICTAVLGFLTTRAIENNKKKVLKTDSAQRSSNKCKN